jgi:hypothetical protein
MKTLKSGLIKDMYNRIELTIILLLLPVLLNSQNLKTYTSKIDADDVTGLVNVPLANDFQLKINGHDVFVYNSRTAAFAYFDFEDSVSAEVTFGGKIYSAVIRPGSRMITYTKNDNKLLFTLTKPENLIIEINENIKRPLFIFAGRPETDIPDRNDKNVIWFKTGNVYYPGTINLESGKTIYIEGGAVVRGSIIADGARNIRICGRGILDGSIFKKGEKRMIQLTRCENVSVEGIIITESKHWTNPLTLCNHVKYENVKVVSGNDWDDGIDIVSSKNIVINGCFIQSKDDCIAIKGGVTYFVNEYMPHSNVENVTVENCVLWNGIWGNGIEIGFETRVDSIKNITFRNCDIVHAESEWEGAAISIHNGDRAVISHITFENIKIEEGLFTLFDFRILSSKYSKDKQRGAIDNVLFRNIDINIPVLPKSIFEGFDETHSIKNVVFQNVRINGRQIEKPEELNWSGKFSDLSVIPE